MLKNDISNGVNKERWNSLSKKQQIGALGAEITRAAFWEKDDREKFKSALERTMLMIDLSLVDRRWEKQRQMLLYFRAFIAEFYLGMKNNISLLFAAL